MRGFSLALLLAAAAVPAHAQYPFGVATPVGASTPVLVVEPAWLGNAGFGFTVDHAPPGGGVIIGMSTQRQDQSVAGIQLYLSLAPADFFFTSSGMLDLSGRIVVPLPLPGPEVPALAGLQVYAQAAVSDPAAPGVLGATHGVLVELEMHPLFAFASSGVLLSLVDPVLGTNTPVGGVGGSFPGLAAFGRGGRNLFVAANAGLYVVDTLAPAPTAVQLGSSLLQGIAYDRVHERLYAPGFFTGQVHVFDANPASATFGSQITQAPEPHPMVAVSDDGRVLAFNNAFGDFLLMDGDPASPTYLQPIATPPSPVPVGVGVVSKPVRLSADGRFASILTTVPGPAAFSVIDRYDRMAGQWIDHDPVAPGYQPISAATVAGVPQVFLMFARRDGTGLVLPGTNGSCRLDFDPGNPVNVLATALPITPTGQGLTYVALSPSGRYLVRRDSTVSGPPIPITTSLVDVASGALTPFGTFPAANALDNPIAMWR